MLKIYEKFNCKEAWIKIDGIWKVYASEEEKVTIIEAQNGTCIHAIGNVEEILNAIMQVRGSMEIHYKGKETWQRGVVE